MLKLVTKLARWLISSHCNFKILYDSYILHVKYKFNLLDLLLVTINSYILNSVVKCSCMHSALLEDIIAY